MRLIDADALIERWVVNGDYENSIYDGAFIIKTIETAPTIELKPRLKGRWENPTVMAMKWTCSVCKNTGVSRLGESPSYNFCPHCGADMREEVQE
jgi:hypothetical protein